MTDKVADDRGALETNVEEAEFGDAFNVAAEVGERAELSPADDPANVSNDVVPPVVETPVVETPVVETPAPEAQQPGESDEKYEQRYKTLQGIHRHDKETWETEKATLLAQIEEAKKPAEPVKTETNLPATLYDSLSEEDKAALKEYDEEFDVVSKMESKKREVELNKLRKEFQTWKDEITAQLAPATALVEKNLQDDEKRTVETHFNTIREGHGDFEQYRDDGSIIKWIETKPKYLQKSLMETYGKGTAEDVVDLITDFKTENNIPITQPSPVAENVVPINAKKAEKKLAMTAVTTRRGAVNASMAVANDYESAFDEATSKGG